MIHLLSDLPDAIPALAAGYEAEWADWYGPRGPGDARADLRERALGASIPFAVVAIVDGEAVGTAAVTATSIASRAHLSPWLTGLWVSPKARGGGIGKALIVAAVAEAGRRRIGPLFTATERGRALFERAGWTFAENANEDGHGVAVLVVDPSDGTPGA